MVFDHFQSQPRLRGIRRRLLTRVALIHKGHLNTLCRCLISPDWCLFRCGTKRVTFGT